MRNFIAICLVIAGLALLAFASRVRAEEWGATDRMLATGALVTGLADWGQTRTIARYPELWRERNPILGEHPSLGRVNTYFALSLAAGAATAFVLPARERRWFLVGMLAWNLYNAQHNAQIGIRVDF